MVADISTVWIAPGVIVLLGAVATVVGTVWIGRLRDRKNDEREEAERREREENERQAAYDSLLKQVEEMHVALLGSKNPFLPASGLVQKVERIEATLFMNGGRSNTVLDRLGRIETRLKQIGGPDDHA